MDGCIDLLEGGDGDPGLVHVLGGAPAAWALTGDPSGPDHWLRVWAARGLLWAWDDCALPAIIAALDDDAWRVREMAVKWSAATSWATPSRTSPTSPTTPTTVSKPQPPPPPPSRS